MAKVVIADTNLGDGSIEREVLTPRFELEVADVKTGEEVVAVAGEADGLLVQWAPITDEVLAALPNLKAIVRYGIGLDNIDLEAASARGVAVHNVDDYCLDEVADHSVAGIYAHNRRLGLAGRRIVEKGWSLDGIPQPLPPGKDPVGIAGFGRIGREAAARVAALGFPIHVWDPFIDTFPRDVTAHDDLVDLAGAVNHLTLHMPLTADTAGMIDRAVLDALGAGGHLVNTARGGLVAEDDLLAALTQGTLGFASLDVLSSEPPVGVAAEIAVHHRVLATPHMAYLSTESLPLLQRRAAEIMRDALTETN
jgi:D-3-phosphoglycerate dehydrogenase / 2-oxoglutarate reductase